MAASSRTPSPVVAIVTVSFHSDEVLPRFLASIEGAGSLPHMSVVVDNDPHPDETIGALAASSGARYLALGSNRGYGAAVNAAARTLPESVRWILVSNPDVVLHPGAIDTLAEVGESDATIGAIGPALLTGTGETYPSARTLPSLRTGVGHALFSNLWAGNPWSRAYRHDDVEHARTRDAGWLSGACLLVRRSAFDELDGFDEGYFMYFEDVDLGYRLGRSGYRSVYEPSAVAEHTGAHSTSSESMRMVQVHHDSAKRFLDKKYRGWWLWPLRAALRIGLAARSRVVVRNLRR
jgi:N-acetylglucosaminyl-diphospho-decaprenol L-rhamnosyltransferase